MGIWYWLADYPFHCWTPSTNFDANLIPPDTTLRRHKFADCSKMPNFENKPCILKKQENVSTLSAKG